MKIATVQLLICVLLVGCATRYNAPDATKLDQATTVVRTDIQRLHDNTKATRIQIEKAQVSADKVVQISGDVFKRLEDIIRLAPPSLKPPLQEVKDNVASSQAEQGILIAALGTAWTKQDEQEKDIANTKMHVIDLESEQQSYKEQAQTLADVATKQSKTIAEYQRRRAMMWTTIGLGGVLCIVAIFLKFFK